MTMIKSRFKSWTTNLFTGGNAKCDVGLCHFTVGNNVSSVAYDLGFYFGGGGCSRYFWKSGGICKAQIVATRLLGGFGRMSHPREN